MTFADTTAADQTAALAFEFDLKHAPEKVWRALTEAGELAHWFPASIDGPREKGAALRFVFHAAQEPTTTGEITECDPPHVLAYTMGEESVRWELIPIPEGCLLTLTTEAAPPIAANDIQAVSRLAA
jgi:uncharacterized protein YndB with AHSA1/START domain